MDLRFARVVAVIAPIALALPAPARAAYEGEGYFRATVLDADFVTRTRSATGQFQEGDTLQSVVVGFWSAAGPAQNQTGLFECKEEGTDAHPRPLGTWEVNVGKGVLQDCVGEGDFMIGRQTAVSATNPTDGELEIFGSAFTGSISVRRGSLLAQSSRIGAIRVLAEGQAILASTVAPSAIAQEGGSLSILDSFVGGGGGSIGGNGSFWLTNTSMTTTGSSSFVGALSAICEIGVACEWQVAQELGFGIGAQGGTPALPASASMSGHEVLAGTTRIRSGSSLVFSSGEWESLGAFTISGIGARARFSVGSRVDVAGELFVGSGTSDEPARLVAENPGTVVDVAGDLRIGNLLADPFPGEVTVLDGAIIIVRGTLLLRPDATLDLQPGGTVYAAAVDLQGTVLENGGVLVVPEPATSLGGAAALGALAARARRERSA